MSPRRLALLLVPLALMGCAAPVPPMPPVPSVASVPARVGASGLLIRLNTGSNGSGAGGHRADYLVDGTVIRWSPYGGKPCTGLELCGSLERNALTASGQRAFRAALSEYSDLLAKPIVVKAHLAPGRQPSGRGQSTHVFVQERPDGTRFAVEVSSTASYDAPNWAPDPAVTRLNVLAETMLDPATLGPGSLADPVWTPYVPTAAAVVIRLTPAIKPVPFDGPFGPDMQKIGWPLGGAPDTFGTTVTPTEGEGFFAADATSSWRCALLANDAAVVAISTLPPSMGGTLAAGQMVAGMPWGSGGMRWGDDLNFGMRAVTLLPEDVAGSCLEAFAS
jgi:hypothetical protein